MVSRRGTTTTIIIMLASTLLLAGAFSHPMMPRPSHYQPSYLESGHLSGWHRRTNSLASVRGGATDDVAHSGHPMASTDESETLVDQYPSEQPQQITLPATKTRKSRELLAAAQLAAMAPRISQRSNRAPELWATLQCVKAEARGLAWRHTSTRSWAAMRAKRC